MEISPALLRELKRLSDAELAVVQRAVRHFLERTNENALQVERKSGLEGIWAFRVTQGQRMFFLVRKEAGQTINLLFHYGRHDDYRTVKERRPKLVR